MTDPNSPSMWADPTRAGSTPPPQSAPPLLPPPPPPAFAPLDSPPTAYGAPQYSVPVQPGTFGGYGGYGGYGAQPAVYPPGLFQPTGPPPQTTNGMAIASMVVSIAGAVLLICYGLGGIVAIVGAILGHVARRQVRERREAGGGMALAGVIVGWVSAALGLAIAGLILWAAISLSNQSY
jgi:hypothetical protein